MPLWIMVSSLIVISISIILIIVVDLSSVISFAINELRLGDKKNIFTAGGRTKHWVYGINLLMLDPFQGYGLWISKSNSLYIVRSMHNYFFEAWLSSGIVGAIIFTIGLISIGWRLVKKSLILNKKVLNGYDKHFASAIYTVTSIFIYTFTHSMVESSITGVNNYLVFSLIYCIIVSQVASDIKA